MAFRRKKERCIADFAAGDGELLLAAAAKWPEADVIATDIDSASVRRLRTLRPAWKVGKCDFLDGNSRQRTLALRDAHRKVSLVVLNPPFSCRGSQRHAVTFRNEGEVMSSRAMAFIMSAAEYLASDGRIAAILPESCLYSKKDAAAWVVLRKWFNVRTQKSFGIRTFDGCSAKTAIVTLTSTSGAAVYREGHGEVLETRGRRRIHVRIVRGAVPVHKATNGWAGCEWPVVHTTNLRNSKVGDIYMWLRQPHRNAAGPAILLPRVGKPDFGKFAVYRGRQRLVLSDCVYALLCDNVDDAECLHRRLGDAWECVVMESYTGTCAPYLTIDALVGILGKLGCVVVDIEAVGYGATQ